ncbi:MAG: MFS transporter [Devosia sp.]|nr:MFS transporter [Devosia sp.]
MKYRVGVIALLFSATVINSFDRASLSVAVPFIIKEFGITAAVMGVALSAFFMAYVLGNLFGGVLADRFGSKIVLGASFAIWSVFSALTGLAHNVTHIILARFGVGIGEGPYFPAAIKVIGGIFPTEERGFVVGFNSSGNRVGLTLCPIVMAFLITGWGWRVAFYITGGVCLVWVLAWAIFFKDLSRAPAVAGGVGKPKAEKLNWLTMLQNRAIIGLVVVKFTQDFLQYLFLTWIPSYLITGRHFSVLQMGFYTTLAFGTAAIAQPFVGFLSDQLIRWGWSVNQARKTVQVGLQVLSATIIVTGWTGNVGIAIFFMVLAISAESACAGHIWTIITDVIPEAHVGSVGGMVNAIGAIGGIVSPIVTGVLVTVTGNFQLALTIGGGSILIATVFLLFVVPSLNAPWYDALGVQRALPQPA